MTTLKFQWDRTKLLEHYTKCVEFYAYYLHSDGELWSRDFLDNLQYEIADTFDELVSKDQHFGDDDREGDLADLWYDKQRTYRDDHPDWYETNWLANNPLYQLEAA